LVLSVGCSGRPEAPGQPIDVDLTQVFQVAHALLEPGDIEVGSPDADRYLEEGWSETQAWRDGRAVRAIMGPRAQLRMLFDEPADRRLSVRCAARSAVRRRTLVRVDVNRRRVDTFGVTDQLADYTLVLPARVQRPGENEITISSGSRRPRTSAPGYNGDVVVERIRFLDDTPTRHRPRATGQRLLLPVPSTFDFFARIPPFARLSFDLSGIVAAELTVDVGGGSASDHLTQRFPSAGPVTVDLDAYAGRTMQVVMRASGGSPTEAVALDRPRISGSLPARQTLRIPRAQVKPNILFYVIDTLRADHLSGYGYGRRTSPNIDALARDGVSFSAVVAQSSWTRPAVATLLTGLNPPLHGAVSLRDSLRPDVPTMATLLQGAGYATAAFVTNYNVAARWGLQRGFAEYRYLPEDEHGATVHVRADALNREVFAWLDQHRTAASQPFFLYVHATDPHAPYTPPVEYAERMRSVAGSAENAAGLLPRLRRDPGAATTDEVQRLVDAYDGEIAFVDHEFGELVAKLRAMGLWDATLVVLTADHGEEFHDHGAFEHGRTLFQELIHVPLVMRFPDGAGRGTRFEPMVRQADVLPTMLDYLGIPPPSVQSGRSLLASAAPAATWSDEAFSQTSLGRNELTAYVSDGWKVILGREARAERIEAYDLTADVAEKRNRASEQAERVGYAKQAIAASRRAPGLRAVRSFRRETRVDPATEERLRALGYTD
jgi:arylsulfatase A-like enzyme